MLSYIIRRLLLIIPTLLGILLINFIIVQAAPGGPVEQIISQIKGHNIDSTSRIAGTDCYAHGLMASGFVDVLLEANLKPYDYIASVAIVSGAGGKFTDWNGNDLNLNSDGRIVAAGDPKIHKQLLKIIQKIK